MLPRDGLKGHAPFVAEAARVCGSTLERFGPFLLGHPMRVSDTLLDAHRALARRVEGGPGNFPVGVTLAMQDYQAVPGGEAQRDEARGVELRPVSRGGREPTISSASRPTAATASERDGPLRPRTASRS